MNKVAAFILFSMLVFSSVYAQEDLIVTGYVKGLTSLQSTDGGDMTMENIIHNRFNLNWYVNDKFTFNSGVRNRIITGYNVRNIQNYSDYLSRDIGFLDMSLVWVDNSSLIGISQLDRLNIDYTSGDFQITVGRQRINWSQTFVWNPNDLFNTYSYFDFDYEEKPGSDAVRIQYYVGQSSKVELSTSLNWEHKITSIGLYKFNAKGYDIQFIGGVFNESDYVIGGGFSGSIAGGGFSGELTYFHPMETDLDEDSAVTFSLHYDYTFSNSLNLQFETLYNGFGEDELSAGLGEILFMDLSPKNLFPTKFALFASGAYNITPLSSLSLSGMYGPQGNFLYVGPTYLYSLSNAIELSGIGQFYSMDSIEETLADSGIAMYLRLKWSF